MTRFICHALTYTEIRRTIPQNTPNF